jgi:hypothetical protein
MKCSEIYYHKNKRIMKYIKTFEQFINESKINEDNEQQEKLEHDLQAEIGKAVNHLESAVQAYAEFESKEKDANPEHHKVEADIIDKLKVHVGGLKSLVQGLDTEEEDESNAEVEGGAKQAVPPLQQPSGY